MASVVYNRDRLIREFFKDPKHPMRNVTLFRKNYRVPLSEIVEIRIWKIGDVVKATGIPPHIKILLENEANKESIERMGEAMKVLTKSIEDMHASIMGGSKRGIRNRMIIEEEEEEGRRGTTSRAVRDIIEMEETGEEVRKESSISSENREVMKEQSLVHLTEGKLSRIPPDYVIPGGNLKTAWIRYFCWDGQIPPLREITGKELCRKYSSTFSKYKSIKEGIIAEAKKQKVWSGIPKDEITAGRILNRIRMNRIIPMKTRRNSPRRVDQLSWITLAHSYYVIHKEEMRVRRKEKEREEREGVVRVEEEEEEMIDDILRMEE